MKYKFSILICSLKFRLPELYTLLTEIERQGLSDIVEVLYLGDNKSMTTGEKRNHLKRISHSDRICYIDDDDRISMDYIEKILKSIIQNPNADAICFEVEYHNILTGTRKNVYFSKDVADDSTLHNDVDIYYRKPNHLMVVKKELAPDFPDISHVEDDYYGTALKPLLKTEVQIPEVLYYYDYNIDTSQGSQMPKTMDVIIVSDGTGLRKMTQDCIDSLNDKAIPIVLEKNKSIIYEKSITEYQEGDFNYNKYLNEGASKGHEEFIVFSNNDILFCPNFIQKAIWEMHAKNLDVGGVKDQNKYSPDPLESITGWCFIMKRKVWESIGHFRQEYKFYAADWGVTDQIKEYKYKVLDTVWVIHRVSKTLKSLPSDIREDFTIGCVKEYNRRNECNRLNVGT